MKGCFVYFIKCNASNKVKIGFSTSIENRLNDIDASMAMGYELLYLVKTTKSYCIKLEKITHDHFEEKRVKREWFDITEKECLKYLRNDLLQYCKMLFLNDVTEMVISGLVSTLSYSDVKRFVNTNLTIKRKGNVFGLIKKEPIIDRECNMNFSFKHFYDARSALLDDSKNVYLCPTCNNWHVTRSEDKIKKTDFTVIDKRNESSKHTK